MELAALSLILLKFQILRTISGSLILWATSLQILLTILGIFFVFGTRIFLFFLSRSSLHLNFKIWHFYTSGMYGFVGCVCVCVSGILDLLPTLTQALMLSKNKPVLLTTRLYCLPVLFFPLGCQYYPWCFCAFYK